MHSDSFWTDLPFSLTFFKQDPHVFFRYSVLFCKGNHFDLAVFLPSVFNIRFQLCGDIIGNPIRSALITYHGGDLSDHHHAKSEINGEHCFPAGFCSSAERASIFCQFHFSFHKIANYHYPIHGLSLTREPPGQITYSPITVFPRQRVFCKNRLRDWRGSFAGSSA